MTISAKYEPIEYIGDGKTRNFVPPFRFFDREIEVTINGSPTDRFEALNGAVVFHTAPAKDSVVVFKRRVPLAQEVKFIEGENFPAADFEYSLDRLYMALQELKYNLEKAKEEAEEEEPSGDIDGRIEALTKSVTSLYNRITLAEIDIKDIKNEIAILENKITFSTRRVVVALPVSVDMWQENTSEEGYSYSASIICMDTDNNNMENHLWSLVPTVVFYPEQADSGNFSTYAALDIRKSGSDEDNYGVYVTIYAKEKPTENFEIAAIKLD